MNRDKADFRIHQAAKWFGVFLCQAATIEGFIFLKGSDPLRTAWSLIALLAALWFTSRMQDWQTLARDYVSFAHVEKMRKSLPPVDFHWPVEFDSVSSSDEQRPS